MSKAKILIPKPFPTSCDRATIYETVCCTDIVRGNATLADVRAIALAGQQKIGEQELSAFPKLELISKFGVGYDSVDVDAASARGIVVTNTPDVLTDEVADLAMGLLVAAVRRIPQAERFLREGHWQVGQGFPLSPSLRGKKVGILGLGRIGQAIADRLLGMKLDVVYCNRRPKSGCELVYYEDLIRMASDVDVLVVSTPGGPETEKLVSAEVIAALGAEGTLVNIARGNVVDEDALTKALQGGALLAAGLDVFVNEPIVPAALLELDNVVLLPHVGSGALETRQRMGDLVFDNLDSWFEGRGAITPVR
ncbi:2-hydroxyacid dehydrogenase [Rhodobacteraceae bacterium 2CG4]|uniref:2-hydroxyacid dehydrogenase n=1 Tax=Halovulum marinum TaxID=2662447 RepID=A0A6L5Z3K7_9RHOB|nr:2-hydroxyacid dehydrogenase [Halovulum marinum]MSU91117.1 2-hydroxyacid dehydrogenase [Halovulum marinum]